MALTCSYKYFLWKKYYHSLPKICDNKNYARISCFW